MNNQLNEKKKKISDKKDGQSIDEITYEKQGESAKERQVEQDCGKTENKKDSSKFENMEMLLAAYQSLDAELAKKRERIIELENQLSALAVDNQRMSLEENTLRSDEAGENLSKLDTAKERDFILSEEALEKIIGSEEFVAKILNCEKVKEITSSAQYLTDKYPYGLLYESLLSQPENFADMLLKNKTFMQSYILKDCDIKDLIISQYLRSILKNEAAPKTISDSTGNTFALSVQNKPKTLKEAAMLAEKLIKRI